MRTALGFTLALILVSAPAHAQLADDVHAGSRVRLTLKGDGQVETHTGTVVQVRGDSVVMRDEDSPSIIQFSSRNIASLDVSEGRPFSRWDAMKWSAITGFVIGGAVGDAHYDPGECEPVSTACRNTDIIVGGLQGAALGAGVGYVASLIKGERWRSVIVMGRSVSLVGIRLENFGR